MSKRNQVAGFTGVLILFFWLACTRQQNPDSTAEGTESVRLLECTFDGNPHDRRITLRFKPIPGGPAEYLGRMENLSGQTQIATDAEFRFEFDVPDPWGFDTWSARYIIRVNRYTSEAVRTLESSGHKDVPGEVLQTTGTCATQEKKKL
jgi:hypothetical protein